MPYEADHELTLLESIYASHTEGVGPSQRDLAGSTGLSLGLINSLLKRFSERGWIKFSHLTGRSFQYAITPVGVAEISRRAIDYFTRAAKNASLYRAQIDSFVREAKTRGIVAIILVGPAELDFLFDYSCERYGLKFLKNVEPDTAFSERSLPRSDVISICAQGAGQGARHCDVRFADILLGDIPWPEVGQTGETSN